MCGGSCDTMRLMVRERGGYERRVSSYLDGFDRFQNPQTILEANSLT